MSAHVVEDCDRSSVVANRDDRTMGTGLCRIVRGNLGGQVVALVGKVGGAADAHPLVREDSAMFFGEHVCRRICRRRQHARLLERQPGVLGEFTPHGFVTE
jgi:hypothetical protein